MYDMINFSTGIIGHWISAKLTQWGHILIWDWVVGYYYKLTDTYESKRRHVFNFGYHWVETIISGSTENNYSYR